MVSRFFRRRIWLSVSRTTVAGGGTRMITCSYVFIEDCSIWTMESVLFSMRVTNMVYLSGEKELQLSESVRYQTN